MVFLPTESTCDTINCALLTILSPQVRDPSCFHALSLVAPTDADRMLHAKKKVDGGVVNKLQTHVVLQLVYRFSLCLHRWPSFFAT